MEVQTDTEDIIKKVLEHDDSFIEAVCVGDHSAVEELLNQDVALTDVHGCAQFRDSFLSDLRSTRSKMISHVWKKREVSALSNDVFLVTGVAMVDAQFSGYTYKGEITISRIWVASRRKLFLRTYQLTDSRMSSRFSAAIERIRGREQQSE